MGSACLRELASSDFDDARFAAWITSNSPDARLEQIALAAGPASFLEFSQVAAKQLSENGPSQAVVRELFDELSGIMLDYVAGLSAEPLTQLEAQAHAAIDRLRKNCPAFEFDLAESLRPKGPLYTDSPNKRELLEGRLEQQIKTDREITIDAWLQACRSAGILLKLTDGRGLALFDNPRVNGVYALQIINSELASADLRKVLKQYNVQQIKSPRDIVDFELLYWIIAREFHVSA